MFIEACTACVTVDIHKYCHEKLVAVALLSLGKGFIFVRQHVAYFQMTFEKSK